MAYAHSANDQGLWHDLASHLRAVADSAKSFADNFGVGELGWWAGLWHDLGKYNPRFQKYLEEVNKDKPSTKVPHAIWGAILAYRLLIQNKLPWEEATLIIAGHHAGLKDPGYLLGQIQEQLQTQEGRDLLRILQEQARSLPMPKVNYKGKTGTSRELGIRLAFSAIVDADYLDTEKHFNPKQTAHRNPAQNIEELWGRFQKKHADFLETCDDQSAPINEE